jgi:hypothetical protein
MAIASNFEDFWVKLQTTLSSKSTITNWTVDKGETGENFTAGPVCVGYVIISAPSALNEQKVPKADFKLIYDNWRPYLKRAVRRGELMNQSRFTKYTISIIHQYQRLIE